LNSQQSGELIERLEFIPFTERTITDKAALMVELDLISRRGFAYDDEEFESGVVCVAVALRDKFGEPAGAISVSGPVMRLDGKRRLEIASVLRTETEKINRKMLRLA
jgi:DNA-binding IclR family transcriptional regulator